MGPDPWLIKDSHPIWLFMWIPVLQASLFHPYFGDWRKMMYTKPKAPDRRWVGWQLDSQTMLWLLYAWKKIKPKGTPCLYENSRRGRMPLMSGTPKPFWRWGSLVGWSFQVQNFRAAEAAGSNGGWVSFSKTKLRSRGNGTPVLDGFRQSSHFRNCLTSILESSEGSRGIQASMAEYWTVS